jgi:Replication-relaxation
MADVRQPRATRKPEPQPVRIQERDRFILEALAKMRFLTTTRIASLAFAKSRWAANKRLRKLLDAGMVRVWVRSLNHENVYSLDRAGAKLLKIAVPIPRGLDGNLDHLLSINRARIALAMGLSLVGGELANWRSDWELRAELKTRAIPDALFTVRWATGEAQSFALEVDHRTRSTRGFLKKLLRYAASRTLDCPVLFVGHEARWVDRYRSALAHNRLGPRVWFTNFELLESQGIAGRIFSAVAADDRYSLPELARFPYGKEGRRADCLDTSGGFATP